MDVRMTKMSGIEALENVTAYNPSIPVIIMTAYSSVESAVEALKTGSYDYLIKPLVFEVMKLTLERAHDHAGLRTENTLLKEQLRSDFNTTNIIGKSRSRKELLDMLSMAAPSESTVLISGESGTGREFIARSLHPNRASKDHPLVVVNCAAITETLLGNMGSLLE